MMNRQLNTHHQLDSALAQQLADKLYQGLNRHQLCQEHDISLQQLKSAVNQVRLKEYQEMPCRDTQYLEALYKRSLRTQ
ncbi:hypothetical protein VSAK1_16212 [Vibrio mediterranei AK1]|uniref:hypothetical protein n=1 Tax=Vibrio TaxID=662 RepID=UPI0001540763|nr:MULTISPECIES: hypothetical protein [Vibrio]EDL54502.1 hypothetical protein VSAK1_16212 [Vibrio mediterranei AK1]USE03233.1 hypothetical protein JKJ11_17620 [Vibrio sp. SCSIO 43133]